MERSTQDLREVLFKEIDDLRSGQATAKRATALSKIATNIINTARLDLDASRHGSGIPDPKIKVESFVLTNS